MAKKKLIDDPILGDEVKEIHSGKIGTVVKIQKDGESRNVKVSFNGEEGIWFGWTPFGVPAFQKINKTDVEVECSIKN